MIKNSLIRMISIVFITLFAQTTFAEALTPQEADLLIKEDVAATQVLAEVCPALTGNNPLLKTSVHDKFHRTLILSGFCLLKIAKISLNSSFFPKPIKR